MKGSDRRGVRPRAIMMVLAFAMAVPGAAEAQDVSQIVSEAMGVTAPAPAPDPTAAPVETSAVGSATPALLDAPLLTTSAVATCGTGEVGVGSFCVRLADFIPASDCPSGTVGVAGVCVITPDYEPCSTGSVGIFGICVRPEDLVAAPPCDSGQVGAEPVCIVQPGIVPCPAGSTGALGVCVRLQDLITTPGCDTDQIGTEPVCITRPDLSPCPAGTVGVAGLCIRLDDLITLSPCDPGQVGVGGFCVQRPAVDLSAVAVNTQELECEPPYGLDSSAVSSRSAGPELTQYFLDGVYRVTRCDSAGRPVITMTVTPTSMLGTSGNVIYVPSEIVYGSGHERSSADDIPDGHIILDWLEDSDPEMVETWTGNEGEQRQAGVIPPTVPVAQVLPPTVALEPAAEETDETLADAEGVPREAGSGGFLKETDNGCTNGQNSTGGRSAMVRDQNMTFFINDNRLSGDYIVEGSVEDVRRYIINAYGAWTNVYDDCGANKFPDQNNVVFRYGGHSTATPTVSGTACDTRAVFDFGDVANLNYRDNNGTLITNKGLNGITLPCADASDVRLANAPARRWSIEPEDNETDIRSTATHEAGHVLGFKDLYADDNGWLTMYGVGFKGRTYRRSLGRGDIESLQEFYPHAETIAEP